MPLTGSDTILAASLKSMIMTETAAQGLKPPDPKALTALCNGIAKAVIAHFLAQAVVAPGIPVATSGGAGSTGGPGKLT